MKKYLSILVILAVLIPCLLSATGTITQTYSPVYSSEGITNTSTLTFAWTSTATGVASGATSTTITDQIAGKKVEMAVTQPDATDYPDANYDITITDANNADIMGSVLLNRASGATEQATPYIGALYGKRPISGALTLNVSNAGSGKSGTVILYLSR